MERDLNIIIVEDDTDACTRFREYVETISQICIVGITNSSQQALQFVNEMQPDAIILDLELNCGQGNGLLFLQDLQNLDPTFRPFILVTTNNSSNTTYNCTRELGADFIMSKHQDDYSEENVIDFLIKMKHIIQKNILRQHSSYATTESPAQYEKRIRKRISMELDKIGISPKLSGYQYLIDAIYLVFSGQTTNVCVSVGQMHSKTRASIDRAMQTAINKAWCTADIDELLANYTTAINSEKGVPTVTEFIFYYANKIKKGY